MNNTTTLYIRFTFNNIFIHLIINKEINFTFSPGKLGFKNRRKKTPFAFKTINTKILNELKTKKIIKIDLILNGFSIFKQTFLSILLKEKDIVYPFLKFLSISDITKIPHNGCKLKKKRRV